MVGVSTSKCNENCSATSSGQRCGGRRGATSAYIYSVVASNSLAIETKNFRGDNVSDYETYPVMTGEVSWDSLCVYRLWQKECPLLEFAATFLPTHALLTQDQRNQCTANQP